MRTNYEMLAEEETGLSIVTSNKDNLQGHKSQMFKARFYFSRK